MDTKSLGLIGLLTAARDYRQRYADSLIVAIDNQDARRWLRVSDTHQRADLVGIRSDEQGKFIVEAIEVKAREDESDVFVQKKGLVQGKAVEQVLSIKEALEQAFSGEREALGPPRRETLRDLFYTECQSRRYVNKFRAVWADRLKTLFSEGTPIQFNALIYQIDLRHDQSGEPEIRRADMGDGQIAEIVFTALGEKQVQRLLAGMTLDNRPDLPTSTPEPDDPPPTTPNPVERVLHDSSELKLIHQMPLESEPEAHPMPKAANDVDATWLQNIRDTFKRHARFYNIEITQFGEPVVGFSVIRFPFRLASGTRKERLDRSLEDIGREMAISNLIVQTIPNSQFLALDVPHPNRQVPLFYSQGSDALAPIKSIEELPVSVGISPDGKVRVIDLKRFVHMLVGGTTGAGKTVFLYSVISSLLWTHPGAEDLELILCSSKLEDFSFFRGLPHLYGRDIITEAEDAIAIIGDISRNELDRRGSVLSERRMRSTEDYNRSVDPDQRLHPIVVIVDEFADLSDQVSRDRAARAALYDNIRRIAQIGRSRSVHLVLCTQRPTADLFPSNIKTLMNVRVAFRMNSQTDSRTILDEGGAERLLGKGDMLFKSEEGIERLQGFFVNVSDITGAE